MPDATGLELIAADVRSRLGDDAVVATDYAHERATLQVRAGVVHEVLRYLKQEADEPFDFLASLHGCDYLPEEPRLGVHYQLLSMDRVERLGVKTRVTTQAPTVPSVVDVYPGADFQEKEVFDFFGVVFDGHPALRRLHMPEDYEGHPQRRDFPIGGEPVLYTFNEEQLPRWYD